MSSSQLRCSLTNLSVSSLGLESEIEPSKSRPGLEPSKSRPGLGKSEGSRYMSQSLSRKLSIDNILDDHGVKRSTKDIVEHVKITTYFDKKKYFKGWLWVFGALALMITFGVGWVFPDGGNPTCDPSDTNKNKTVCGMIDVLEAGEFNFAFLSGFIIAGFVSSGVKLWLARRSAYSSSIWHLLHLQKKEYY
eukprot:scaffold59883_cov66-Cyclotella_meneghiniana.AAC.1